MRRRLFNLAAAVSLVLCAACAFLWVRSYRIADMIATGTGQHLIRPPQSADVRYWMIESCRGGLRLSRVREQFKPGGTFGVQTFGGLKGHRTIPPQQLDPARQPLRPLTMLGYREDQMAVGSPSYIVGASVVGLPWALLTAAFALMPVVYLLRRTRCPKDGSMPCPTCGYDLRATPERCPECGTPVEHRSLVPRDGVR